MAIPLALAVLLSFLLSPPVRWLEKTKIGRIASVAIVLIIAFAALSGITWVCTDQFTQILTELPQYQSNLEQKLNRIRNPGSTRFSRALESLKTLSTELSPNSTQEEKQKAATKNGTSAPRTQKPAPVPVQVVKPESDFFDSVGLLSGSVLRFMATFAAVVVLTLFMLIHQTDLRNRLFGLIGRGRISMMTAAMDDAAHRVSQYLTTQLLINAVYGALFAGGLFLLGVPYPFFWGVLALTLRFIPYVGTLIAGGSPFILSLAVFDDWKRPLLTLALWGIVEIIVSCVLEPWLYAERAGISSLAILLSASFWTMLWGPIGLIVSTPLTVCLVVLGRHVPQLEFLYILMGDSHVLAPEASYYQRLLAQDDDEARQVVDTFLKEKSVLELYDSVLIPALALSKQDRHQDALDDEQQKFIHQTTRDLIHELNEEHTEQHGVDCAEGNPTDFSILCAPAKDEADELVAMMLAQILNRCGYMVKAIQTGFVADILAQVTDERPDVLFISTLRPFAISHARSLCRRSRQQVPGISVVIGLWGSDEERNTIQERLGTGCSEYVISTLAQAEVQLRLLVPQPQGAPPNEEKLDAEDHELRESHTV